MAIWSGHRKPDEADGGPPNSARYLTRETNPYRLPSMELQALVNHPDAFQAITGGSPGRLEPLAFRPVPPMLY